MLLPNTNELDQITLHLLDLRQFFHCFSFIKARTAIASSERLCIFVEFNLVFNFVTISYIIRVSGENLLMSHEQFLYVLFLPNA